MARPPFSSRKDPEAVQEYLALRGGVPDGLCAALIPFVTSHFYKSNPLKARPNEPTMIPEQKQKVAVALALDWSLPDRPQTMTKDLTADPEMLLNVVDFILGSTVSEAYEGSVELDELNRYFRESRSAYMAGINGDGCYELQHRQPSELTELVEAAIRERDRAADHLRRAWSKAFERESDPNGACDEAVKAIEAAAKATVSPNNNRATLGTMIQNMADSPAKWTTESESDCDIGAVIAMMKMIWTGHYRHGNESDPIEVSPAAAEMIVHQASLLVHWFQSDRIRRC